MSSCVPHPADRLEHAVRLFEIEKGAADFRGHRAARGFERSLGCFATRASRLHAAFGRESVEEMPRAAHADKITVIKFRTGRGIALVVNFVARKSLNVRTQFAPVDLVLSIFDLNIDLSRANLRAKIDNTRSTGANCV